MPALQIYPDVVDRSHQIVTKFPKYAGFAREMDKDGIKEVCERLSSFQENIFGHVSFLPEYWKSLQSQPTKCIINIRDPRDIVVAEYHNILKNGSVNWLNVHLKYQKCRVMETKDPIRHLIDFALRWEAWTGWLDKDVFVARYEDLRLKPRETVEKMAEWLRPIKINIDVVVKSLLPVARNPTFRKGEVGEWKTFFTEENKKHAEKTIGHIIERLGYEI
jgi:hypothetical protein